MALNRDQKVQSDYIDLQCNLSFNEPLLLLDNGFKHSLDDNANMLDKSNNEQNNFNLYQQNQTNDHLLFEKYNLIPKNQQKKVHSQLQTTFEVGKDSSRKLNSFQSQNCNTNRPLQINSEVSSETKKKQKVISMTNRTTLEPNSMVFNSYHNGVESNKDLNLQTSTSESPLNDHITLFNQQFKDHQRLDCGKDSRLQDLTEDLENCSCGELNFNTQTEQPNLKLCKNRYFFRTFPCNNKNCSTRMAYPDNNHIKLNRYTSIS